MVPLHLVDSDVGGDLVRLKSPVGGGLNLLPGCPCSGPSSSGPGELSCSPPPEQSLSFGRCFALPVRPVWRSVRKRCGGGVSPAVWSAWVRGGLSHRGGAGLGRLARDLGLASGLRGLLSFFLSGSSGLFFTFPLLLSFRFFLFFRLAPLPFLSPAFPPSFHPLFLPSSFSPLAPPFPCLAPTHPRPRPAIHTPRTPPACLPTRRAATRDLVDVEELPPFVVFLYFSLSSSVQGLSSKLTGLWMGTGAGARDWDPAVLH